MTDFRHLWTWPLKDGDWIVKILLGSFISIIPVLNFLALGYFAVCINYGYHGRQEMPEWDNWADLFREGATVFLIMLVYILLPAAVSFIIAMLPVVGLVLASILAFIFCMVMPMSIANYSRTHNFSDAFQLGEIFYYISRVINPYTLSYLIAVILLGVGAGILGTIPVIGFLGSVVLFYTGIIYANFIGFLYHQATVN